MKKIIMLGLGGLAAASIAACSGASGGVGHSDSYNQGNGIASHELVQQNLMVDPSDATGACESAYNTYKWGSPDLNESEYVQGCADWVKAHPRPAPSSYDSGPQPGLGIGGN